MDLRGQRWRRAAGAAIAALAYALVAGVVIELEKEGELFAPLSHLDELPGVYWLWLIAGFVVALVTGAVIAEATAERPKRGRDRPSKEADEPRTAAAPPLETVAPVADPDPSIDPPSSNEVSMQQLYRELESYAEAERRLLLAVRSGLVHARNLTDIKGADFCFVLPARQMTERVGTEVLLSLWTVKNGQFQIVVAPRHPGDQQELRVPADDSWVVRQTARWRAKHPRGVQDGDLLEDEHLPALRRDDLAQFRDDDDAQDLRLWFDLGYRAMCAVPLNVGDEEGWVVALCTQPNCFVPRDEGHLRVVSIGLELSSRSRRRWRDRLSRFGKPSSRLPALR